MAGLMNSQESDEEEYAKEGENELTDESSYFQPHKGMFRDPTHAAKSRHRFGPQNQKTGRENNSGMTTDLQNLKHLKLSFPTLKGGGALECLRDCRILLNL